MYAKINELIWKDDKFPGLSDDAKLLFIYALTCPHHNILGYFHLPKPYASYDLGWSIQRLGKRFDELLEKGLINYNETASILLVKNYLKYNPLENQNQVKGAIKALDKIPFNSMEAELLGILEGLNKPLLEPLMEHLGNRLERVTLTSNSNSNSNSNSITEGNPSETISIKKIKEEKKQYADFVTLTEAEFVKLVERFGIVDTEKRIQNLSLYKGSKGVKYASDYMTILSWANKEDPKPDPNKPKGPGGNISFYVPPEVLQELEQKKEGA